ncbi:MAG TPA: hybrid sensor histidine kinase/response regulator, partial [Noviherbaspirillum sp.]
RKDEFLAMLAHELRNPLAPIRAAAELLQMAPVDATRLRQTSEIIARQVNHMTGLVDDLLDVSRVSRGLATINKAPQDMKTVVSNAVEQVRPVVEARHHQLAITIEPAPAWVLGDDKRLVQVLTNLIHNAAKYTPEGGRIRVEMQARDEEVALVVTDNGIGILPELQPRIFDAFTQAERTPDRSQGGLGLGLALVKSLVEFHGGRVDCFSAGAGQGSRFTVCLPRIAAPLATEAVAAAATQGAALQPLRVMVVDDNVDAAAMLALLLETAGHVVLVEHHAVAALERAAREKPDVCFLDIGLPGMDGLELARRLRAAPHTAQALLVAVTGYGQAQDKLETAAAGFDVHLIKPVSAVQLAQVLATPRSRS